MLFDHSHAATVADATLKGAPPVTVATLTALGVHLPQVALVLTIIYTFLQIIFIVRDKIYRPYFRKHYESCE